MFSIGIGGDYVIKWLCSDKQRLEVHFFFVSLKYLPSFTFHSAGSKTFQSTFVSWRWIDFINAPCFTKQVSKLYTPNKEFCLLYSEFSSLLTNIFSKKHTMFALTSSLTRNLFLQTILILIYCWYQRKWNTRKLTSKLLKQFVQTFFLTLISTAKTLCTTLYTT